MYLHDAQNKTDSWCKRHSPEAIKQLGTWRWRGIQDNAALILNEICSKHVIDFGGKDGPLGFGSVVIDKGDDITICKADVVFSSHTLEHIQESTLILETFHRVLNINGCLILHVPSFTCKRWRDGYYHNKKQTDHLHTFCLSDDSNTGYECIDRIIAAAGFNIEFAEYVGDDSILVIARRRE